MRNVSADENGLAEPLWTNDKLIEGFCIFVALCVAAFFYFTIKTLRLRKRRCKVRKYGILTTREDVEMAPLGEEEDDEDSTVFDINDHSRP